MNDDMSMDREALIREVVRYLETVELFRAECCEPTWLPEHTVVVADPSERHDAGVGIATH